MTYNMRLFVGSAVILLMAVVFAQPVLAQGTESYTSIVGMNDITQWIINPSFEQNVATYGQYLANTYNGWTLNTGSKDSSTFRPTTNDFYGTAAGQPLPTPSISNPGYQSACTPVGYTTASDGGQILGAWRTAFIAQTLANSNAGGNWKTASHQTYVFTFEYGMSKQNNGLAMGHTALVCYSNTSVGFCMLNDDTHWDTSGQDENMAQGYMYQFAWSFTTDMCTKSYIGASMTIRLGGGTNGNKGNGYDYFDNVHMYTTAAPEPSTVILLITGALGMLAYAWRRKRRK